MSKETDKDVSTAKLTHAVHFSSKSQTWNTPKSFWEPLNKVWKFTLDAAALSTSALVPNFYSPENSGLDKDWSNEVTWCNPPYDNLREWVKKCYEEYEKGGTVLMLIPSRTDTLAFQNYIFPSASAVCFIRGRLKFDNPSLPSWKEDGSHVHSSAPFPSCLVVFDDDLTPEKIEVLNSLGSVVKIIRE